MRLLSLFVLCSLFLMKAATAEKFVLGAEDQAGPWGQRDGTGCGNDIVKAAFAASGDSAVLEVLPYVRAKKMAVEGELAGCFAMSWESGLKERIAFADTPLYHVTVVLLIRHGEKAKINSLADLPSGSILGLVKDYEYPGEVRAVGRRTIKIEEVASEGQNLLKLAAGRIGATVVCCDPLKSLSLLLKQAGVEGNADSVSVVGVQDACVGFSIRNPAGMRAKKRFNAGMAAILKNGSYDSIVQVWLDRQTHSTHEGGK